MSAFLQFWTTLKYIVRALLQKIENDNKLKF